MRVYEATVIDKTLYPEEGPNHYAGYIAVVETLGQNADPDWNDEDIHYYFTEDEFKPVDGEIETEEFKYLIGKRVA